MIESFDQRNRDNPQQLTLAELARIDQICIEFERDLRSTRGSSIEEFLRLVDDVPKLESVLLSELLFVELEYYKRQDKPIDKQDYLNRFPASSELVESVFTEEGSRTTSVLQLDDWGPEFPTNHVSLNNSYQLTRYHARGGLGVVYVAHDPLHHRDVIVKFPRKRNPDADDHQRLAREAAITGRLEHPGIVPVYATGTSPNDLPCFVMQFVDGETLKEAVKNFHAQCDAANRFETLAFRQLLQRFLSVCNTAAYAHGQGVIHRDIKPGNIMLGKFGKTILLDWGLAKRFDMDMSRRATLWHGSPRRERTKRTHPGGMCHNDAVAIATTEATGSETMPGRPMGTPEFASPEQVLGHSELHDVTSDIYSLGATLYFLLTGKRPLDLCHSPPDQEAYDSIPSPREREPKVPTDLDSICRKAMSPEQHKRYLSAEQLADDLERYLGGEPTSVGRESWRVRIRRWGRKHPRIASGLAAGLMVGIAGLAISSGLLNNERSKLATANTSLIDQTKKLNQAMVDVENSRNQAMSSLRWLTDRGMRQSFAEKENLNDRHRAFLAEVLQKHQAFADLQSDDAKANAIRAEGHFRIAQVHRVLSEYLQAKTSFKEACRLFAISDLSDSEELQEIAARCRFNYGLTLLDTGDVEAGRQEMLSARDEFQQLLVKYPGNEHMLENLAQSFSSLATVSNRNGTDTEEAIVEINQALNYATQLVAQNPNEPDYQHLLGGIHNNLGQQLLIEEKLDGALEKFLAAIEIQQPLVEENPDAPHFRSYLAKMYYNVAHTQFNKQNFDVAREYIDQSVAQSKKICESFPQVAEYRKQLAASYSVSAQILSETKDYEECFRVFEQALMEIDATIELAPEMILYQQRRFSILNSYGYSLGVTGRHEEAREQFEQAVNAAQLQIEHSDTEQARVNLANAHLQWGRSLMGSNELQDAVAHFVIAEETLAALPSLDSPRSLGRQTAAKVFDAHARMLMGQGKLEEAVPVWERAIGFNDRAANSQRAILAVCLGKSQPRAAIEQCQALESADLVLPNDLFNVACAYALASQGLDIDEQDSAHAAALKMLWRAKSAGYFNSAARVKKLSSNPSFRGLMDHPEFARFLNAH